MDKVIAIKVKDPALVAYCGLYCGTCFKYKKRKCLGCIKNEKATWCKIRTCNIENKLSNCSECETSLLECKKLNNPIGKLFSLVFKTDRIASLNFIKENGGFKYHEKMYKLDQMSIKKGQKI